MAILRRGFVALSIGWAVLLPVAPFAASQAAPAPFWYGLAFVVYGAGSVICHQLPARSFHTWSAQWPVCARCTGIYFGAAVAAILATVTVRLKPDTTSDTVRLKPDTTSDTVRLKPDTTSDTVRLKPDTTPDILEYVVSGFSRTVGRAGRARVLLAVAAFPTAVTLVYEWTTGQMPSNALRALAGAPLGAAIAIIVVETLRSRRAAGPASFGPASAAPEDVR